MKYLYLVRHAKSSWKHAHLTDHDRPLNKRGKANAPEMGKRLKATDILPSIMVSSTANRAYTTAKVIAEQIGYPISKIELTSDLYHADEDKIIDTVRRVHQDHDSAMIFGHNPGFTEFANTLGSLSIENIPTCGVVAFQLDIISWNELNWGDGKLLFFDYPKKVKSL